ncbi:MAG: porin family protein [Candidatus Aminicenantes bacterium]|nr:MAG: porin family protein [Candidatus Aminicenantes bacterium]
MERRVFRFFVMVVFCVILASGATAKSGFFIGVQGGWSMQKPSFEEVKFDSDSSFLYGARVGVKFMMFAIEANFFQAAHNLVVKELAAFDWEGVDVDYNYLGINARIYIPLILVHPYFTVGYGSYSANLKDIGKDTNRGINVGLGVELQLGDKFSLMAEGKYHNVKVDILESEMELINYTLSGGFNFYF